MTETVLLVGNGINNINNNKSWESLLQLLHSRYYDPSVPFEEIKQKPFPLVYEQIVLWQLKKKNATIETTLKKLIAGETNNIIRNKIHEQVASGKWKNIITPNYEFNLMDDKPDHLKNEGCVTELIYSVFRNFNVNGKTFWHIHGDAQNTNSINLGFEHYCGQLQRIREYVTGGYKAKSKLLLNQFKRPLLQRPYLNSATDYSWLDFFFKNNTTIKIFGFRLELEEIDLWWLLTYRAKTIYRAVKHSKALVNNTIQYFIPRQYTIDSNGAVNPVYKNKRDLLQAMDIEVIEIDLPHTETYYQQVLDHK